MKGGSSMPREAQILAYDFEVNMELQGISVLGADNKPGPKVEVSPEQIHQIVMQLNYTSTSEKIASGIAGEMQSEMKGVLSNYKVSVEIFFNEGSIVALGVILVTILSPIVTELGKTLLVEGEKALVSELTPVIKVAIQRALRRNLPLWLQGNEISKMEVAVSPSSSSKVENTQLLKPAEIKTDSAPNSETKTDSISKVEQITQSEKDNTDSLGLKQMVPQYFVPLTIANTVLLLVLLILLTIFIIRFP
jgi:hypothetical protein